MNYTEKNKERRNLSFRTGMDLGMGIFYISIGCVVIYYKAMGAFEIYPAIAYLLGGMMIVGGGARFLKGFKAIRNKGGDTQSPG